VMQKLNEILSMSEYLCFIQGSDPKLSKNPDSDLQQIFSVLQRWPNKIIYGE
jgi:hypothetical protein